jgi:hypothetical protein
MNCKDLEILRLNRYIAHYDGDAYRQCAECGSLDFEFRFYEDYNQDIHKVMECNCDKCDNIWKVNIE